MNVDGPREAPFGDEGVAWMLAWCRGDERAFDRIVERYSGPVYTLLTRFLGPVPQREDLVQEVFLRLVRARERYVPDARFTTFLWTIVFNLATNERERERLRRTESLVGDDDSPREHADEREIGPLAASIARDAADAVRRAIDALPPAQKMALILARYEGLSYAEIGRVLGTSEKAVKSAVHRARETLRVSLSAWDETAGGDARGGAG
jgi:RNA polymerase sigma-70 factor, ECF subfamily